MLAVGHVKIVLARQNMAEAARLVRIADRRHDGACLGVKRDNLGWNGRFRIKALGFPCRRCRRPQLAIMQPQTIGGHAGAEGDDILGALGRQGGHRACAHTADVEFFRVRVVGQPFGDGKIGRAGHRR